MKRNIVMFFFFLSCSWVKYPVCFIVSYFLISWEFNKIGCFPLFTVEETKALNWSWIHLKLSTLLISYKCQSVSHSVVSDSLYSMDCSPPGSSVHGILQAGIPELVNIPFSIPKQEGKKNWSWVFCSRSHRLYQVSQLQHLICPCPILMESFQFTSSIAQ